MAPKGPSKAPQAALKAAPKVAPKAVKLPAAARAAVKKRRADLAKGLDITKCRPKGFHTDRIYKMEYSKLIHQTVVVDGLKLKSLADLLKAKEIVVVTEKGEQFGMLPLTSNTPHLRPYALKELRSIAKEFHEKSGGYKLLVSSLFRSPDQQIREAKKNPTAIKPEVGASTHLFGNTFDFTIQRFLAANGTHTAGDQKTNARLIKILDSILVNHQKCGTAMGYWEIKARHVIAAKS